MMGLPEADHSLTADAVKAVVIARFTARPHTLGDAIFDGVLEVSSDPLSGFVEDDGHGLVVDHAPVALSTGSLTVLEQVRFVVDIELDGVGIDVPSNQLELVTFRDHLHSTESQCQDKSTDQNCYKRGLTCWAAHACRTTSTRRGC
jgi:hypothetical protein